MFWRPPLQGNYKEKCFRLCLCGGQWINKQCFIKYIPANILTMNTLKRNNMKFGKKHKKAVKWHLRVFVKLRYKQDTQSVFSGSTLNIPAACESVKICSVASWARQPGSSSSTSLLLGFTLLSGNIWEEQSDDEDEAPATGVKSELFVYLWHLLWTLFIRFRFLMIPCYFHPFKKHF